MPITTDKTPPIGLDPVTVNWSKFEKNPNLNPCEIPVGSVVYYIRKRNSKYYVDYGIVYQHYSDCVMLQRVTRRDLRIVKSEFTKEPVPFKDFPYQTEWRKLPKGWTWSTRLFEILYEECSKEESDWYRYTFRMDDPATIIEGYNKGYLVNVRDVPYEKIDDVIEKDNGYKLVRKSREPERMFDPSRPIDTVGINFYQCFTDFDSAFDACMKVEDELRAQAEMSDLEWSAKLIDDDLNKWARLFEVSEENKARVREYLMSLKDLENVETKVDSGGIQWRVFGKTRWNGVNVE